MGLAENIKKYDSSLRHRDGRVKLRLVCLRFQLITLQFVAIVGSSENNNRKWHMGCGNALGISACQCVSGYKMQLT